MYARQDLLLLASIENSQEVCAYINIRASYHSYMYTDAVDIRNSFAIKCNYPLTIGN